MIAELPSIFGRAKTAQMTYYRTRSGAKVFAAGAMGFGAPQSRGTARMLDERVDLPPAALTLSVRCRARP